MSKPVNSSTGEVANYTPPQENKKKANSFFRDVFVGFSSGIGAVTFIQPMIYFKNVAQTKASQVGKTFTQVKGFEKNPRVWYRGVGGFAASFAPTIAIQNVANSMFSTVFNPFISATAAGAASAIIVCPAEGIMIQQQKTGKGFFETTKYVFSNYGFKGFYRKALVPTTIREGAFTGGYGYAAPRIKEEMVSYGINEGVSQVVSGVVAGVVAATISQPFDTAKTIFQGDMATKISMKEIIFQKKAFAGFGWRAAMIATATTVMPYIKEKVSAQI